MDKWSDSADGLTAKITQLKTVNESYSTILSDYEKKLHLVEKFVSVREKVKQIDELLDGYEKENAEELVADIRKISDEIIEEL